MDKDLKNSYDLLELPITATKTEVITRQKALIKIYKGKEIEDNVVYDKEITKITNAATKILDNINENGIPEEVRHKFEVTNESIVGLLIVFAFISIVCFFSFYMFI